MGRAPSTLLALAAAAALVSGCGGGEPAASPPASSTSADAPPGSIQALLDADPREDSAVIFGTSRFAVGENRISFLLVNGRGELVEAPGAEVLVARGGLDAAPVLEARAELLPVGAPAEQGDDGDFAAPNVWVTRLELDQPGLYTFVVDPPGAPLQGFGQIEVAAETDVPQVGEPAVPSDNPTVANGFPQDLTTAEPPDVELLQHSVADSIADGVPFVVTFATPKFCASRVCGPVVDIVDEVRKKLEGRGVRFIHVEVFEGNDPNRGYNRWMQEWSLETEPWTFVVDGEGIVRARFEGLVTAGELEQAIRDML